MNVINYQRTHMTLFCMNMSQKNQVIDFPVNSKDSDRLSVFLSFIKFSRMFAYILFVFLCSYHHVVGSP